MKSDFASGFINPPVFQDQIKSFNSEGAFQIWMFIPSLQVIFLSIGSISQCARRALI